MTFRDNRPALLIHDPDGHALLHMGRPRAWVSADNNMGLTAKEVETARPGLTLDGDGLYLQVGQNGNRSWIYRYALNGRTRDMGLGSAKAITLKRARELATAFLTAGSPVRSALIR